MITTFPQSDLSPRSLGSAEIKAAVLEPLLVIGVSAFWLVTLPIAAAALVCVKAWDAVSTISPAHPLILRRGSAAPSAPSLARDAAKQA